jgi:TRAP-type C4-dicarboxylate transport system permease small subunit
LDPGLRRDDAGVRSALRRGERALDGLVVVLFTLMFGVIIVQIALRYVFNYPLVWTDEAASYLLVWISFLGWTMAARRRIHIGINVVADRLPPRVRRALHLLWCIAGVLFALVLLVVGAVIAWRNGDVRMVSIDFAFWPVYLAVPVAAVFLAVYALRDLWHIARKGDIRTSEAKL